MTATDYTCEMCGETYEKSWSDENAASESVALFGAVPQADLAIVCDDCFARMSERFGWAKPTPEQRR